MRVQYTVTLFLSDGSRPQFTCWAKTAENAIHKIKDRERSKLANLNLEISYGLAEPVEQEK